MLRSRFVRDSGASCGLRQFLSSKTTESFRFRAWNNYTIDQVGQAFDRESSPQPGRGEGTHHVSGPRDRRRRQPILLHRRPPPGRGHDVVEPGHAGL